MTWRPKVNEAELSGTNVSITRWSQTSNDSLGAAGSVITVANVVKVLPLVNDGSFTQLPANSGPGLNEVDLVNDWIDISNCDPDALVSARLTITNNGAGNITASPLLRLIPDRNSPGTFIDIIGSVGTFKTQHAFARVVAFNRGIDVIQIGIVTDQAEDIYFQGVLFETVDKL